MNPKRTKLCSRGTCDEYISCSHPGDKHDDDMNVVRFLIQSYGMWAYKIAIEVAPSPVDKWLDDRKSKKKKRLKKRAKRREQNALRRIGNPAGV